jgi:hypothetical protein
MMELILFQIATYAKLSIYIFVLLLSLYNLFLDTTIFYAVVSVLIIPSLYITYHHNKLFNRSYTIKTWFFKVIELLHVIYIIYYSYYSLKDKTFILSNKWNLILIPFYGLFYGNIIAIYLFSIDM